MDRFFRRLAKMRKRQGKSARWLRSKGNRSIVQEFVDQPPPKGLSDVRYCFAAH